MQQEVAAVLSEGSLRARLTDLGAERSIPADVGGRVDTGMERWARVLREAGVRPQ